MKDTIIALLKDTKRDGIEELIDCMEQGGFFEAPCSSDKHLAIEGGLAKHSLNVVHLMMDLNEALKANIPWDSIVICGLLHDLGKMGDHGKANYVKNVLKSGEASKAKPYKTNPNLIYLPHEIRSAMIVRSCIELSEDEETAILWHNGLYSTFKYDIPGKETPLYMVLHWADMWASRVTEQEGADG
ncbi:MAG: HDIG domain-containing protein [Clostridia bacterium]|nr:HDIG domain-containing protein [Clostridia bacterium]